MKELIDLDTLFSYHKAEANEAIAYLTILFTISLGLLSYLGSIKRIGRLTRLLLVCVYISIQSIFGMALINSYEIHSAIHREIKLRVDKNPSLFMDREPEGLGSVLSANLNPLPIQKFIWGGIALNLIVVFILFDLGPNGWFNIISSESRFNKSSLT